MGDFSNTQYLYSHLPSRYRTADAEQDYFLLRFLSHFGEELDKFDEIYDTLHEKVSPYTAPPEWVDFMLESFFGWSWFPEWFTPEERLFFLQDIHLLYAKRGTPEGIEELLLRFGVRSRVIVSSPAIGEMTLGMDDWLMPGPLGIIVQIFPEAAAVKDSLDAIGEFTIGASHLGTPSRAVGRVDIDRLLRFSQPLGQVIMIEGKRSAA